MGIIKDVTLTHMKIIAHEKGSIIKLIKSDQNEFYGFGEAYLSSVNINETKDWRRHKEMYCNLVVIRGEVSFKLFDNRMTLNAKGSFMSIKLSRDKYVKLTIPPNIWFCFKGEKKENQILNISNRIYDPNEVESLPLNNNNMPKVNW
tara:strand:- start:381 stop:821 length:441 start_codon:yes stop_codon:yes gene_type:complete